MGCTTPGTIYFGTPGALVDIEYPRTGIKADRERPIDKFNTDAGGIRVAKLANGKRQYVLNWEALSAVSFYRLLEYDQGHRGVGPFAFLDPGQVNLLTVNQSSATSETNDTTGFTVAGVGGVITSNSVTTERGVRALKWAFGTATPGASTVTLNTPTTDFYGIPVLLSTSYAFSARFITSAGTTVTITPEILWYTAAGAYISTSSGVAVASAGAWAALTVAASAPATAAYALCRLEAGSATIGVGDAVNFDSMQFEHAAAAATWVPGTGTPPVVFMSFTGEFQRYHTNSYRIGPTLTLQEVGG